MGANVVHGKRLQKKEEILEGGLAIEIVPIEGGYHSPSYSSVHEMVEYARTMGIDPSLWPIYYDSMPAIVVDEVYSRCQDLRQALSGLRTDQIEGHFWLKSVYHWLTSGESFCITE